MDLIGPWKNHANAEWTSEEISEVEWLQTQKKPVPAELKTTGLVHQNDYNSKV